MRSTAKRPWVQGPDTPHTPGENHRTVNIRVGRDSVSIKCQDQKTAHRLKLRLIGVLCEVLTPPAPNKLHPIQKILLDNRIKKS